DRALVEDPIIAEAAQIELEALQLHAGIARKVRDSNRREIRSAAFECSQITRIAFDPAKRTQRRELGTVHVNLIVPISVGIRKHFEQLWFWHHTNLSCHGTVIPASRHSHESSFPRKRESM